MRPAVGSVRGLPALAAWAAYAVFFAYVALAGLWAKRHVIYGYDVFFYLGCAQNPSLPADSLLARSTREIRADVPAARQDYFFRGLEYRRIISVTPEAYLRQLPFYRGRVLYYGPVAAAWEAGWPPVRALPWMGLLPAAALAILMFHWLGRHFRPWEAAALAIAIAQAARLWPVAADLSPDALAQAFLLGGVYAWMERRSRPWAWACFGLALLSRPDTLLFSLPMAAWMAWDHAPAPKVLRLLPLLALAGAYAALQKLAGQYGWATLFHHTFIGFLLDPTRPVSVDFWQYRAIFLKGLRQEPWETAPWFWLAAGAALAALRWRRAAFTESGGPRDYRLLLLLTLAGYLAHYLLFPIFWGRLILEYHLAMALCAAVLWARGKPAAPEAALRKP